MSSYQYTTLGEPVEDVHGNRLLVKGLAHPATDEQRAAFEVIVEGTTQLDLTDPAQRIMLGNFVNGLLEALAHGEAVGWTGRPADVVEIRRDADVEWTVTHEGRTVKLSAR